MLEYFLFIAVGVIGLLAIAALFNRNAKAELKALVDGLELRIRNLEVRIDK